MSEWNTIVNSHISEGLPKALKAQKKITTILKYVVPMGASILFLAILTMGLNMYGTSMQAVLLVIMASLFLPMWVVMPLAQLFTSQEFAPLDEKSVKKARTHIDRLAPHLTHEVNSTLNDMLTTNTTPAAWWDELREKTLKIG